MSTLDLPHGGTALIFRDPAAMLAAMGCTPRVVTDEDRDLAELAALRKHIATLAGMAAAYPLSAERIHRQIEPHEATAQALEDRIRARRMERRKAA